MEAITDTIHVSIIVASFMFLDMYCAQDTKFNSSGIIVLHGKCSKKDYEIERVKGKWNFGHCCLRLKKLIKFGRKFQFKISCGSLSLRRLTM